MRGASQDASVEILASRNDGKYDVARRDAPHFACAGESCSAENSGKRDSSFRSELRNFDKVLAGQAKGLKRHGGLRARGVGDRAECEQRNPGTCRDFRLRAR
jgi:hypothetical protein